MYALTPELIKTDRDERIRRARHARLVAQAKRSKNRSAS
jgi:hypothetical protein